MRVESYPLCRSQLETCKRGDAALAVSHLGPESIGQLRVSPPTEKPGTRSGRNQPEDCLRSFPSSWVNMQWPPLAVQGGSGHKMVENVLFS